MCDWEIHVIADHNVVGAVIWSMKREITQVNSNMVRCSTIQEPSRAVSGASGSEVGAEVAMVLVHVVSRWPVVVDSEWAVWWQSGEN